MAGSRAEDLDQVRKAKAGDFSAFEFLASPKVHAVGI
jgi:hypothetical protein